MRQTRILTTGWRNWPEQDKHVIWDVLDNYVASLPEPVDITLVHGMCPYGGADLWAEQWAIARGHGYERHPAERTPSGRLLGPERNSKMVDLGADVCFGFPGPNSRGTVDCMKKARRAGVEVKEIPWQKI